MAEALKELNRYARIARNAQMLLVMEPPERAAPAIEEARGAIVQDAFDFLTEVQEGVESPYFTTYTRQDARYIDTVAADKMRLSEQDLRGIFLSEPTIKMADKAAAQAASFAYLAASWMRTVRAPFYQAPLLRITVAAPRNLAEFVDTVATVKDTTLQASDAEFHQVVQRSQWRIAFAFWEANRQLAGMMGGN